MHAHNRKPPAPSSKRIFNPCVWRAWACLRSVNRLLEPIVQGSRFPNPEFHVPLYRRPRELIAAGHKPGSDAFPNKGARIGRQNGKHQLVPYYDRGAIEAGALDGQKLEICWLKIPSTCSRSR